MVLSKFHMPALAGLLFLFFPLKVMAHPNDSLQHKTYRYLFDKIRATKENPQLQNIYLKAFLAYAKEDDDPELLMNGYKNYMDYTDKELKIAYSDSMIAVAKKSGNQRLMGIGYLSRGVAYYRLKNHEQALTNYIAATPHIENTGDKYLAAKLHYNIATVKYYLGKDKEALTLLKSSRAYFCPKYPRACLNTIHLMGLVYNQAGDYKNSEDMVVLGYQSAKDTGDHTMDHYFMQLQGLNQYFSRNYASAIELLDQALPAIKKAGDYANVAVANFYIAKSLWALKRKREGLPYLLKVDAIFTERNYIRGDLRETYELLIDFHKADANPQKVIFYVDRLLKADSLLRSKHDRLYDNIYTNYDTKKLMQEKQQMQQLIVKERSHKKMMRISISVLLLSGLVLLYRWQRYRRRQQRIFRELMQHRQPIKSQRKKGTNLDMASETLDKIVELLNRWEAELNFLDPDITLTKLAAALQTNTRYLSQVISSRGGKNFNTYINNLRISYIIEELKNDRYKRLYTHEALAREAGFGTTQSFVTAFKARTGISPHYFSQKIKKEVGTL